MNLFRVLRLTVAKRPVLFAAFQKRSRLDVAAAASDPVTFAIVPLLLEIVALAACFVPARYTSRVSPAQTLRS